MYRQLEMRVRMTGKPAMPTTPEEWQDAADWCEGLLAVDSCRQYGLVTGGPDIDVERCVELLAEAKRHGVTPAPDAIERVALILAGARRFDE